MLTAAEGFAEQLPAAPAVHKVHLASDLKDEASRTLAVDQQRGAQATPVVVSASGIWHQVLRGPPVHVIQDWSAFCGWSFGRHANAQTRLADASSISDDRKKLCQKSFPDVRRQLKKEQQDKFKKQFGESA